MTRSSYFFVLAIVTIGCGGLGDPTGSTCPADSTLTYDNFGRQMFAENCSCHVQNRESPSFASLEKIRANSDEIDKAAAAGPDGVNDFMPEDGSMPESTRRQLGEWLACGAP